MPHKPHPRQLEFLKLDCIEALYGGGARGGKTDAGLMGAAQYLDVPGYSALLLRRTYPELVHADGLIPRSHEWWGGTAAEWNGTHSFWTFPSGARVAFGHMQHLDMKYKFGGSTYHYIFFDELTEFERAQYTFLFSRLNKPKGGPLAHVPLRMRAGTNPTGRGLQWVKRRFIDRKDDDAGDGIAFVPALLKDNPSVDQEAYRAALARLDVVERARLADGDWDIRDGQGMFRREWFRVVPSSTIPAIARRIRYWDPAATEPRPGRTDPDWFAGARLATHDGQYWIEHMDHFRAPPRGCEERVFIRAQADGPMCGIRMEQEPGSAGVAQIDRYARSVLRGYEFKGVRSTGDKVTRARPLSAACEQGLVHLVDGPWIDDFLDEVELFPQGAHDDQVDAASGAFEALRLGGRVGATLSERRRETAGLDRFY